MCRLISIFLTIALMLPSVRADRVAVIMAKDNRDINLSFKELQNIFRRKVLVNANGQAWIPLNLTANHVLRIAFAQKLFDQPPEAMENYWNELYFQGIMPPYVVDSEEAMLRFVSNTPGAIGYVLPCHLDNRVQVVANLKVNEPVEQGCNAVIP